MDFTFSPEQEAFRAEVRSFCAAEVTAKGRYDLLGSEVHDAELYRALAQRGYIGMQWPRPFGGQGRSHVEMAIFYEEVGYAAAPMGRYNSTVIYVGESLIAFGSERQQQTYLPRIAAGEITFCWCLSEPDAGSDAAALKTRAEERAEGGFRITGQKIFTSGAHVADLALVAARTNPDAPKHHGISLFLVPLRDPRVSVRPLWTIGGWRVNQVFLDGVDVPPEALVGQRDNGWAHMRLTLSFERSAISKVGMLMRVFDRLLEHAAGNRVAPSLYGRLVDLRAEIEAMRFIAYRIAWLQDRGEPVEALASMNKLRSTEVITALGELGMEILGECGVLRGGDAPLRGEVEYLYRNSPFFFAGGGTPDIQRIVIAGRGLGLPRR